MSGPENLLPSHLVSDASFWRLIAGELRRLTAAGTDLDRVAAQLEADDAYWRADLLDRAWTDVDAFLRLLEARCQGIGLDAALMCAFPDA
jgi:hypothetical protein